MDPLLLLALILGLAVGSFLNVLISRLPDPHRSLFKPARSACPGCQAPISSRDNIPVLSYLWLRGKCRNCQKKIGVVYPLVELAVAIAFVGAYLQYGPTIHAIWAAFFVVLLIGIAVTDAQTYLIPDLYTLGGAAVGIGLAFLREGGEGAIASAADGLLVAALLFGLGRLVSLLVKKDALGFGDVLMVAMMATFLSFGNTMVAIFLGACSGVVFAIIHSRIHPERLIPLGLHLAVGGVLALLVGDTPHGDLLNALLPWH